jgi:hypothetical protein
VNPKNTPESILHQITGIQRMEKGALSTIRQTAKGPSCNFQRWEDGRNHSEYVPADQVAHVLENLQAHARFETLVASYVQALSTRSREERLAGAKKKRPTQTSASPRKRKSKA